MIFPFFLWTNFLQVDSMGEKKAKTFQKILTFYTAPVTKFIHYSVSLARECLDLQILYDMVWGIWKSGFFICGCAYCVEIRLSNISFFFFSLSLSRKKVRKYISISMYIYSVQGYLHLQYINCIFDLVQNAFGTSIGKRSKCDLFL